VLFELRDGALAQFVHDGDGGGDVAVGLEADERAQWLLAGQRRRVLLADLEGAPDLGRAVP
jgi:hypothetical protein